jgi:hypothetical protein
MRRARSPLAGSAGLISRRGGIYTWVVPRVRAEYRQGFCDTGGGLHLESELIGTWTIYASMLSGVVPGPAVLDSAWNVLGQMQCIAGPMQALWRADLVLLIVAAQLI